MIYAFDSSTIELCLKLSLWAEFHHGKGADFVPMPRTTRSTKLVSLCLQTKTTALSPMIPYASPITTPPRYIQTHSDLLYVRTFEAGKVYRFLANNFLIEEPRIITELYCKRQQIEFFFKRIKRHLHMEDLLQNIQNAVYTLIQIAICDNLRLIIAKKRYGLVPSIHSVSNSIGQVLFRIVDIRELYNQPTLPANVWSQWMPINLRYGVISPDSSE